MLSRINIILVLSLIVCLEPHNVNAVANSVSIRETIIRARKREQERLSNDDLLLKIKQVRDRISYRANENISLAKDLEEMANEHFDRMEALLHSDDGKRIARDPVSFITYVGLKIDPAVNLVEVRLQRDEASSLVERAQLGEDDQEVGYLPKEETQLEIYDLNDWLKERLERLKVQVDILNDIVHTNASKEDMSNAKPLVRCLTEYNALWQREVSESTILGKQLAKEQKRQILIDNSKFIELDRARAEAERIRAESDAELARLKQNYELKLSRKEQAMQKERSEWDRERKDAQAEIDRLRKIADAERKRKDTQAEIEARRIDQDTEYRRKVALARSDEVQTLLAPFIAKGYYQPGLRSGTYEPSPVSLKALQGCKALEPTVKGLKLLLIYGVTKRDKERPRWSLSRYYDKLNAEQKDRLRQAQQYIIYLDDILVQEGLFSP